MRAREYYHKGEIQKALEICLSHLSLNPQDADAWNLSGLCMLKIKQYFKAQEYFKEALKLEQENLEFWINFAESYRRNHQYQEACEILKAVLLELEKIQENKDSYHNIVQFNLALCFKELGETNQAIVCLEALLKSNPKDYEARFNLGNLVLLTNPNEALAIYQECQQNVFDKDFLYQKLLPQIALTHTRLNQFQEALEIYENLKSFLQNDGDFWFNYANCLNYATFYDLAKEAYYKALSLNQNPIYGLNLAFLLLRLGDFHQGFRYYEWRLLFVKKEKFLFDEYQRFLRAIKGIGEADLEYPRIFAKILEIPRSHLQEALKNKKIVIYCEQGFGDSILFSRYLIPLKSFVKELIFIPQKELKDIFEGILVAQSLPLSYDYILPLGSLPLFFEQIPSQIPLKRVPQSLVLKKSKKPKIALAWKSTSGFQGLEEKSFPILELMEYLKDLPYIFESFQKEGLEEGLENLGVIDKGKGFDDFLATLEALGEIEWVITLDSALAHLALSAGVKTIVLLPKRFDWRYGDYKNPQSKWYPQGVFIAKDNCWQNCFKRVREILLNPLGRED